MVKSTSGTANTNTWRAATSSMKIVYGLETGRVMAQPKSAKKAPVGDKKRFEETFKSMVPRAAASPKKK